MTEPPENPGRIPLPGRILAAVASVLLVALLAVMLATADYADERERWQRMLAAGLGLLVITWLTLVPNNPNIRGAVRGTLTGILAGAWVTIGCGFVVRFTAAPWDEPAIRDVVFYGFILGAFLGAAVGLIWGWNQQKHADRRRRP